MQEKTLTQYGFPRRTRFLGDALTGEVVNRGKNFQPLELEFLQTKPGNQSRGRAGNAAPGPTASDPVAKVRKVVDAIDEVQSDTAEELADVKIERHETVMLAFLPFRIAGIDEGGAVVRRVIRMAPREPR